jgi:hypothetical protein
LIGLGLSAAAHLRSATAKKENTMTKFQGSLIVLLTAVTLPGGVAQARYATSTDEARVTAAREEETRSETGARPSLQSLTVSSTDDVRARKAAELSAYPRCDPEDAIQAKAADPTSTDEARGISTRPIPGYPPPGLRQASTANTVCAG